MNQNFRMRKCSKKFSLYNFGNFVSCSRKASRVESSVRIPISAERSKNSNGWMSFSTKHSWPVTGPPDDVRHSEATVTTFRVTSAIAPTHSPGGRKAEASP